MPDHHLHGYFRYLVKNPWLLTSNIDAVKTNKVDSEKGAHRVAGGALSLLGSIYGDEDDDDEVTIQASGKGTEVEGISLSVSVSKPHDQQEHAESAFSKELKNNQKSVPTAVSASKDNFFSVPRNQSVNGASSSKPMNGGFSMVASIHKQQKFTANVPALPAVKILEPPSFLKRMMEKIIEFILRNGEEFEAILIEQDKAIGRFPFLLPTNQYYPYYQKILLDAQETKLAAKSPSSNAEDVRGSRRKVRAGSIESGRMRKSEERVGVTPVTARVEDKAKKGTATGQQQHGGVSADQAAAIVMAATRGVSPATFAKQKVEADGAVALSSGSKAGAWPEAQGITSSSGIGSAIDDTWIANTIARTTALVSGSGEANALIEVGMSKEEKLKADRLKRAKMFAAALKSGGATHTMKENHSAAAGSEALVGPRQSIEDDDDEDGNRRKSKRHHGEDDKEIKKQHRRILSSPSSHCHHHRHDRHSSDYEEPERHRSRSRSRRHSSDEDDEDDHYRPRERHHKTEHRH